MDIKPYLCLAHQADFFRSISKELDVTNILELGERGFKHDIVEFALHLLSTDLISFYG